MSAKSIGKKSTVIVLLIFLVLALSACSLSFEKLGRKLDKTIESKVNREQVEKRVEEAKEYGKTKFNELVNDLEDFDLQKIDQWIKDNNLNEYGDKIDTIYEKGSPLIEAPSKAKDRYKYILENHPNLIEELKLKVE